jgi:zinc protease
VDFTSVYANAPADVFPQAVALMADLVRNPTFAEEELDRQRTQTLDGLKVSLASPGQVASMASGRVVYGDAPTARRASARLRQPAGPDPRRRGRLPRRPLPALGRHPGVQRRHHARGRARPGPVGLRRLGAPCARAAAPSFRRRRPLAAARRRHRPARARARRRWSRPCAACPRSDDYFPLTLGNTLLGGSFTSRLNQEIRIKRGLSYGTRSSLGLREGPGLFTASAQTKNETAVEVSDLILAEIERLDTTQPTESELTTRRAILTGAFGSSLETVDGLGSLVANLALYDLPMSDLAAYAGNVAAVDGPRPGRPPSPAPCRSRTPAWSSSATRRNSSTPCAPNTRTSRSSRSPA